MITFQKSSGVSGTKTWESETVKDDCLERFVKLCTQIRERLDGKFFFDFVDPCTGLLMQSNNHNVVYAEITGVQAFMTETGFKTTMLGGCQCICHPVYGVDCYPASMFTNAPPEVIEALIKEFTD